MILRATYWRPYTRHYAILVSHWRCPTKVSPKREQARLPCQPGHGMHGNAAFTECLGLAPRFLHSKEVPASRRGFYLAWERWLGNRQFTQHAFSTEFARVIEVESCPRYADTR